MSDDPLAEILGGARDGEIVRVADKTPRLVFAETDGRRPYLRREGAARPMLDGSDHGADSLGRKTRNLYVLPELVESGFVK